MAHSWFTLGALLALSWCALVTISVHQDDPNDPDDPDDQDDQDDMCGTSSSGASPVTRMTRMTCAAQVHPEHSRDMTPTGMFRKPGGVESGTSMSNSSCEIEV